MYCRNCGKEIDDKAIVCPHCGVGTDNSSYEQPSNTIATVGFVFSFIIAIVGLICSIIGFIKAPQCGGKGRGLALAGIIISVVSMVLAFIMLNTIGDALN